MHEDTWLVRIDHKINENTLLYGRAQRDISLVDAPNGSSSLASDKLQTINHPANYMLALEHTFRPTLFNEVKFYINRAPFHNPQSSALPYAVSTDNFVGLNNNSADIEVGTTLWRDRQPDLVSRSPYLQSRHGVPPSAPESGPNLK